MNSKNIEADEEDEGLPSTNSTDPNERKLARRLRIKRRLDNAEKLMLIAEKKYEEPEVENSLIEETIETSEDTLKLLYLEGKELVSNIRVASDSIEVQRRESEAEGKLLREIQLEEESAAAIKKIDEISAKWNAIVDKTTPLELYELINDQKAKCLELITQKNDLIKSFQLELKISDEKFMKGQRAMNEELALLTKRIDEQVLLMKRAYRVELNRIEESVDVTRSQMTEKYMKSWQSLYNQREKDEVTNMHRKLDMVDKFLNETYKLHRDHQEKFRETRIHLETDIQVLEQELGQVKALCLLNSEKLDYNYQVLKKREEENVYIKNHQKRRLNKLQDMVNTLKKKIDEKRQSTEEEVKKLTREVERYYASVLDTENKANHLTKVNEERFQNIWDMKDEEAKDLIHKITEVDRIVHEQILGLNWIPPTTDLKNLKKTDLPSYKTAESIIKAMSKRERSKKSAKPLESPNLEKNAETSPGSKRLMHHILELIADQSGFLMEEKLDELLKPYADKEKTFVRLDNVFAAIDIRTENDLETMKNIFRPYAVCLVCDKLEASSTSVDLKEDFFDNYKGPSENRQSSILQMRELEEKVSKLRIQAKKEESDTPMTSEMFQKKEAEANANAFLQDLMDEHSRMALSQKDQSQQKSTTSKAGKCDVSHPLVIDKYCVLKALKNFVSVFHSNKCSILTGMKSRLSEKRYTISRILSREDIHSYWENYKKLLPKKLENVWNAVFLALIRYLSILQDRHELNLKVQRVRRQNLDLKRLLTHYRGDKSRRKEFSLPVISSVPDGPIDSEELAQLVENLSF